MNFRLLKYSSYSALASICGTGVALPSYGCFNLYKKNQENEDLLKSKQDILEKKSKEVEEFKGKAMESRALTHEAGKQA